MRITLLLIALTAVSDVAVARSSGRPSSAGSPRRSSSGSRGGGSGRKSSASSSRGGRRPPPQQRNPIDEYDDEDPLGIDDDMEEGEDPYDEYDEDEYAPSRRGPPPSTSRGSRSRGGPPPAGARGRPALDEYDEDEEMGSYEEEKKKKVSCL